MNAQKYCFIKIKTNIKNPVKNVTETKHNKLILVKNTRFSIFK